MFNRRQFLKTSAALTGLACLPQMALAHRQRRALSVIEWNAGGSALELTHSLHLHDAEQALARLGTLQSPDLTPMRARAQLALYTQKHFSIMSEAKETIDTNIVGAEIDNGYVFVYLEAAIARRPDALWIKNGILQDVFLDQVNVVNLDLNGSVKTATFRPGDRAKKLLA